jgi:hypothetical protein
MEQLHYMNKGFELLDLFPGPLTENVTEDPILYDAFSSVVVKTFVDRFFMLAGNSWMKKSMVLFATHHLMKTSACYLVSCVFW